MPAETRDDAPIDFRPAGAAAGAAPASYGLWKYLTDEYPAFKALVEQAEDARTAPTKQHPRGLVDINKILEKVKPGDYALSGVQGGSDPFTQTLVRGSHGSSGGAGAHGQIIGPNVKVHHKVVGTPKGEMPPDLTFLKNDHGELYSPLLAKDRKKFIDATVKDKTWVDAGNRGVGDYGELKAKVTARSQKLKAILDRQKQWSAYDAAGGAAVSNNPRPKAPRPTVKELARAQKLRTGSVGKFKGFLEQLKQHEDFFTAVRPQTEADQFLASLRKPDDLAQNAAQKKKLSDLAEVFRAKGQNNPRMKALSQSIIEQAKQVGAPPTRVTTPSKVFKPKKFETAVPSVLHGGMHNNGHVTGSQLPFEVTAKNLWNAFSPAQLSAWYKGKERYGFGALSDWYKDFDKIHQKNVATVKERPGLMFAHHSGKPGLADLDDANGYLRQQRSGLSADNLYRHTVNEGTRINPEGYYYGPKSTLYLRPKTPVDQAQFVKTLQGQVPKPYATGNAALSALGEFTGLSRLAKAVPGIDKVINTCRGHTCGTFPAQVYSDLGAIHPKFPTGLMLPNRVALEGFTPTIVSDKQLMLKQLGSGRSLRTGLGLGAAGLMGALGYAGVGKAQNMLRGAPAAPKPQLDPAMFSKAMKLLQPR